MASLDVRRHQQLRRLIAAGVPADFADWFDYVAIVALLAFYWQEGPFSLALLAVVLGTPYVTAGPFAGAMVDRADLRAVLIFANLGRALTTAALIFAPSVLMVLVLVLVRGVIDSAFTPARQAAIQILAQQDQLDTVNSLVHGINQLSKIAGPAVAGLLLLRLTPQLIFGVNAAISLLAALMVLRIDIPVRQLAAQGQKETLISGVSSGFAEVMRNPKLLAAIVFAAISMFAVFFYDAFISLLTINFGFATSIYALTVAAVGGGGVLGAIIAAKTNFGDRHLAIMAAGALVSGAAIVALSLFSIFGYKLPVLAFVAVFFAVGVCTAFIQIPYRSLLQHEAPAGKIARVVATGEAVSVIAMLSAPLLGGILVYQFGIGFAFLAGGVLLIMAGLAGALFSSISR